MAAWHARAPEVRALFNPAFMGVLVHDLAAGYDSEACGPLPYVLAFLGVPIILHGPTRDMLPRSVATSIPAHLSQHPEARVHLAPVAVDLVPFVNAGIRYAASRGGLAFGPDGSLLAQRLRQAPAGLKEGDVNDCRKKARFVGRWFARGGDYTTILTTWGLKV